MYFMTVIRFQTSGKQIRSGEFNYIYINTYSQEHSISKLVNRASLAKKTTAVAASPKLLQLELWREVFSAKYGLNGPIKRI